MIKISNDDGETKFVNKISNKNTVCKFCETLVFEVSWFGNNATNLKFVWAMSPLGWTSEVMGFATITSVELDVTLWDIYFNVTFRK